MHRKMNDLELHKIKIQQENSELISQIEGSESTVNDLNKLKLSLHCQLEESKRLVEDETRAKNTLSQHMRNFNYDFDQIKGNINVFTYILNN